MQINPKYILKNILDETVLIPTGTAIEDYNGIISMNEVASFIWNHMEHVETMEEMVQLVLENFEADRKMVEKDVTEFLGTLKELGMIYF